MPEVTWDPATYLRFGEQRSRPFADLLARVGAERPRAVVDLGCGPGTLTATLAARWPDARVWGIDSSPEMVARAAASGLPARFRLADVRDWRPAPDVDVAVSNAVLQWVPDHGPLLARWAADLPPGAWLAVQVPANHDAPSHRAMRAVAADVVRAGQRADRPGSAGQAAAARLADATSPRRVAEPVDYARMLIAAGCAVDVWETTYVHLLPADTAGDHPVLRWLEGTALRPVRDALGDGPAWATFRRALGERLADAYPVAPDGLVYFPFRRLFAVARTASR